jgi:hypothetical protein
MVCGVMGWDDHFCGEDGSNAEPARKKRFSVDPGPVWKKYQKEI